MSQRKIRDFLGQPLNIGDYAVFISRNNVEFVWCKIFDLKSELEHRRLVYRVGIRSIRDGKIGTMMGYTFAQRCIKLDPPQEIIDAYIAAGY